MDREEYRLILLNTIKKNCPKYMWVNLIQSYGIDIPDDKDLNYLFTSVNNIIKICEEFEYKRAYRYSSICSYENLDLKCIEQLKQENKIKEFTTTSEFDDELSSIISIPTVRDEDNKIYLKFSLRIHSKLQDDEDIKHVVLVVINKKLKYIEIRQHTIPIAYNSHEKFYERNIGAVKGWIKNNLNAYISELDLQAITRFMKSNKEEDLKVTAVSYRRNGMEAELDSANNAELTLPILDELRDKISQEDIFKNSDIGKNIKQILENFMLDIEENSDLPAAKILWFEKSIKVHMYHGEVQDSIPILRWIGKLKDKESMDYVAEYIINCKEELRREFED